MAPDTAPHKNSPHDWASAEYVRYWAERTDWEEAGRVDHFDLLADLIPFPSSAAIEIFDLGTGYGAWTASGRSSGWR